MSHANTTGRKVHNALLVVALMAVGAGAAAAPLTGFVTGKMPMAVSQAILVGAPIIKTTVDKWLGTVTDDGTGFSAAANVNTGDWYVFTVPIGNGSKVDLVAELTMTYPNGLSISVQEKPGSFVRDVCRTGPNTWKFVVKSGATLGTDAVHPAILVKIETLEEKLVVLKGLSGGDYSLSLADIKLGLWSLGAELDWFGLTDLLADAETVMSKALTLEGLTPGSPQALALIDSMLVDLGLMKADLPPGLSGIDIRVKVADNVVGYGKISGQIRQITH